MLKKCKQCGKVFTSKKTNKIFCNTNCGELYWKNKVKKTWDRRERICKRCKKVFTPKMINQIYCSCECEQGKIPLKEKVCKGCDKLFMPKKGQQIYCTTQCCSKSYYARRTPEQKKAIYQKYYKVNEIKTSNYENFNNLMFLSEKEFEKWFALNYVLFGIEKLLKFDRFFPDVRAKLYGGKVIDIELEYNAKNFKSHKHNPQFCDLIISFVKPFHQTEMWGVPIIAIFNVKGLSGTDDFNPETKKLTNYFQNLVQFSEKNIKSFLHEKTLD